MKREVICDGETDQKGEDPRQDRVLESVDKGGVSNGRAEQKLVIFKLECRNDRKFGDPPKSDDSDHCDRQN